MLLALSSKISEIDRFAEEVLNIPTTELMRKSGDVVADIVRRNVLEGGRVVIFAGKGNNGGDGYAAAVNLLDGYDVTVFDVFSAGQKSVSGKMFLSKFTELGGRVVDFSPCPDIEREVKSSNCIIDAIFGTGFSGDMPENIKEVARYINETNSAFKIAIDVPVGINADTGGVNTTYACSMNATAVLSFIKPGLVSYPAKSYLGQIVFDDLDLPHKQIYENFDFKYKYLLPELANSLVPKREENSNKGSFGKLLCITGSSKFKGAAHLSLEAALRGGAGYVTYVGEELLANTLTAKYPEAIYKTVSPTCDITDVEIAEIVEASGKSNATLVGCGSYDSDGLLKLVKALLTAERGGPLILDADAINAMSRDRENCLKLIRESEGDVILTPHPLEFSRLCGISVSEVQLHRIESSVKFAAEHKCILVLKGAGTIITDGRAVYINSSGSSALAKAGSGDVLAGFLSSLVASGDSPLEMAAVAVYFHGVAADNLAREFSSFGVIPSDLPKEIARQLAEVEKR